MVCDSHCAVGWFMFVFECVSIPLYFSVVWVMVAKRKHPDLSSSFFTLCISVGVADIIGSTVRFGFRNVVRLFYNKYPWSRATIESTLFATVSSITSDWSVYFAQVFGVVLLSLNRLTAIWKPTSYKNIWHSARLQAAIVIQWLWIFPFALPQLHSCCHSKLKDNVSFTPVFANSNIFGRIWTGAVTVESGFMGLLIVMHIMMIFLAVKHKKVAPAAQNSQNERAKQAAQNVSYEKRFTLIGVVLCGIYLYLSITWLWVWSTGSFASLMHNLVTMVMRDMFTCANPYLLLTLSSRFRKIYIDYFACRHGH